MQKILIIDCDKNELKLAPKEIKKYTKGKCGCTGAISLEDAIPLIGNRDIIGAICILQFGEFQISDVIDLGEKFESYEIPYVVCVSWEHGRRVVNQLKELDNLEISYSIEFDGQNWERAVDKLRVV